MLLVVDLAAAGTDSVTALGAPRAGLGAWCLLAAPLTVCMVCHFVPCFTGL